MRADPIADMLTCIRNALHARKERVDLPRSRMKESILAIMKQEGFISEYSTIQEASRPILRIQLKYDANGRPVVLGLKRVSKPSLRKYVGAEDIPSVRNGLGVNILSTSRGVLADREARKLHIGGEILCSLW
jgi:small subunit ribosomal protein S8